MKLRTIYILILSILLVSCGEGYEKTDGNKWIWVLHSEAGKHVREIDADNPTFEILDYPEYAKDKNNVYWRGIEISNADNKVITAYSLWRVNGWKLIISSKVFALS
jgi:hypothetical protein